MPFDKVKEETKDRPDIVEKGDDNDAIASGTSPKAAQSNADIDLHTPVDSTTDASPQLTKIIEDLPDRYAVLELLGEGGMGSVYKVFDSELQKEFAVKVLRKELAEDHKAVKRFEQECKAASELNHQNLVAVYANDRTKSGLPFLVMDYIHGQTLGEIIKEEKQLAVNRCLEIFSQTCEALLHAHKKGVIHRDLKPSNIMIVHDSGSDQVHVLDFGIAKIMASEGSGVTKTNLTQTGDIFGSPLYMSPEQCENNPQDARSDIYSLGCVMYEALSGVQPFASENPVKVILKHLNVDPEPLSKLSQTRSIPKDLETIVSRCLQKNPVDRYQSVESLLKDLHSVEAGKPIATKPPQPLKKKQSGGAVRILLTIMITSCFAAVIIGMVLFYAVFSYISSTRPASDGLGDAGTYDQVSYNHFNRGEYEKAASLLAFGVVEYKEKVEKDRKENSPNLNRDEGLLAENLEHIGKCYLFMGRAAEAKGDKAAARLAYMRALPWYRQSMEIWHKYTKLRFTGAPEGIMEYGELLDKLNMKKQSEAHKSWAKSVGIDI